MTETEHHSDFYKGFIGLDSISVFKKVGNA